jgi:hypothetical protein
MPCQVGERHCLTGDVDPVKGVRVEGIEQELFGRRVARTGIGERGVGFERSTVRKEQTKVGLFLTEVDAHLQTIRHRNAPFKDKAYV